ncbi:thiol-disulfide oxidoreductase DCC family protein [Niabella aquatica]
MIEANHIILFDGICNLCNSAVQFILKRDEKGVFKFTALQSDKGKALLAASGMPAAHLKSFVYIHNNKVYTRSDAALKVAAQLSYPARLLSWFIIVPKFIRDIVYDLIARNRYKLFGRKNECMLPTPELRARFIDT